MKFDINKLQEGVESILESRDVPIANMYRKKLIMVSESTFMQALGGELYRHAPNRQPRKADIITIKARDLFRKDAKNNNEWYILYIEEDSLYDYIDKLLKSIPEFEELNLSQIEYDNGVNVHDENRSKYSFRSAYDIETADSWKDDFIDLDAFVRNIVNGIIHIQESDMDCFCCKYNKEGNRGSEACKTCVLNPSFKNNYESDRTPKGKYTFACTYNCKKGYYIGCDECKEKDTCEYRCQHSCKECKLVINHKEK